MGEIPSQKKSWKAFSDKLVTLTFESLASVSTEVAVALRGVARIYTVTPRVFQKIVLASVCFRVLGRFDPIKDSIDFDFIT